jgi:hypothetical protein
MDVEDFEERNSLDLILDMGRERGEEFGAADIFLFPPLLVDHLSPKADNISNLVPG